MNEQDLDKHEYHVFWVDHHKKIGKKLELCSHICYRKINNPKHLQNTLKKNIGSPEAIDYAIKNDRLRIILGVEITPVSVTSLEINGVPLEEKAL